MVSYPLGIFLGGFLFFFLTSDLSSWASDLFHLLAHSLVSKKVSVEYCNANKFDLHCYSLFQSAFYIPVCIKTLLNISPFG